MSKCIVINGLPSRVNITRMAPVAEGFGDYSRLIVEHNGTDRSPCTTCWITFQKWADAKRAIRGLNNKVIDGKRVSAHWIDSESDQKPQVQAHSGARQSTAGESCAAGIGVA